MRIYIAASFDNRAGAKAARDILERQGHTVTSRWIDNHFTSASSLSDAQYAQEAAHDLSDVRYAEALLFLNTPDLPSTSGGQHFEMGYAHARHMPIYFIGPQTSVFHHDPWIAHLAHVADVPDVLQYP